MPATGHGSRRTYQKGIRAENMAAFFLRLKRYRIIKRRYKTPVGEIDLVAQKGDRLVFVEVKSRKSLNDAAEAITSKNRYRITNAAGYFISRHPEFNLCDMRFDAILVSGRALPIHIKNAW